MKNRNKELRMNASQSVLYVHPNYGWMIKEGTSPEEAIKAIVEQAQDNGAHAHPWANDDEIDVTTFVDGIEVTATPQSTEDELLDFWRKKKGL